MDIRHKKIREIVEKELSCSAHNLDHVLRVHNLCMFLSKYEENVDLEVLIPAVLLHDIARVKESKDKSGEIDHAILGSEMAEDILRNLEYEEDKIEKIKHCIITHRFRTDNRPKTIEAKILFDADKLDAIGSIGIARSFMLAGQFGQSLSVKKQVDTNTSENGRLKDVSKHSPFIEYEVKFKKIPEKLHTKKAKEIGLQRLKFMDDFFNRLESEIEGVQ
ncbi:MAG: HD domain-containing protein [Clostridium argentinense]|uniref:HD domain-containing protein n=1 Tax=Clostridium butanoliproducens TaxID=2991837 RepID=UPI001D780255|nr:HD domain-containing protein [Clostridium butanoliproducens]MBS5822826.1 HD domain-containing protein [Clostridium argentinense]MDU1349693.1 HD domain-containing protein [Clostridium argentinense]